MDIQPVRLSPVLSRQFVRKLCERSACWQPPLSRTRPPTSAAQRVSVAVVVSAWT